MNVLNEGLKRVSSKPSPEVHIFMCLAISQYFLLINDDILCDQGILSETTSSDPHSDVIHVKCLDPFLKNCLSH